MQNIGKNLKYNRENAKKSVYDIEADLGISHQNQYNWEKGTREPSIIHCLKLADYFGISIDELIGRDSIAQAPIQLSLSKKVIIMEIAEKIKELRKENNKTQEGLSADLNLPRYLISNWEQGRSLPAHEDLIKLADYFNCSIDFLLGREDDAFQSTGITKKNTLPMFRLKELREERNLTQEALAKAVGTSQRNIGRWENGINEPLYSQLLKLAEYFDCSIDYLVGKADNEETFDIEKSSSKKITGFSRRLRELRNDKGLSAKDLAQKLNFSVSIVYEWEHGRCEPSFAVLCKIAKLFDVSVDYLIGNSEDYHVPASVPAAPTLSQRDRELLDAFYMLDVYQQDFFLKQIKATAEEKKIIKK